MNPPTQADHHAARHEAAHAVTAVRLGLPLKYTDTIEHMDRGGRTKLLRAATAANLEAHATVAAAGVVAEGDRRARFWEVPFTAPSAHDIGVLVLVAQRLGLVGPDSAYELGGLPEDDPAFGPWATAARTFMLFLLCTPAGARNGAATQRLPPPGGSRLRLRR